MPAVTSTTGSSAALIEGQTLYRWASLGVGQKSAADIVVDIKKNPHAVARWLTPNLVIMIDEWVHSSCAPLCPTVR